MPIYTFKCDCGKETDAIVPFDKTKIKCECGKWAKREGIEVPAKRNPQHGIQR